LHTRGHSPAWHTLYPQARATALPTYPFQHRRYWLAPGAGADVNAAGLDRPEHPLLGALTQLADQDQIVISGRLSTSTHAWLTGHRIHDSVVFPATGFIELVLHAGQHVDCPAIDELILHTPLVLADHVPTDLQITVHPRDEHQRRPLTIHARTGAANQQRGAWVLHATGTLSADQPDAPAPTALPHTTAIDSSDFYGKLATSGRHYDGPFQGVVGIGHDPNSPNTVYADIALPADADAHGYGIHPALLDAALHPLTTLDDGDGSTGARLPFALTGITLHATAATRLNVALTRIAEDTYALCACDPAGAPVITVGTVTLRPVGDSLPQQTPPAALGNGLFQLDWPALPPDTFPAADAAPTWAVVSDDPERLAPALRHTACHADLAHPQLAHAELVIWTLPLPNPEQDPVGRVHALTRHTLTHLQRWLARPDTLNTQLVVLTRHAVATSVHDRAPDLAHAAAWALVHTTQHEHPGRVSLLDTDNDDSARGLIDILAAVGHSGEPQLALRRGSTHIPRLTPSTSLTPPQSGAWQLGTTGKGDLTNLTLEPAEPVTALAPGQVRVAIRAAGLNFHDVVVALGAIPDEGMGAEAAGVVIDTAADVTTLRRGDAVMGLFPNNAFAPTAVTDHRMVVRIPPGLSFAQAASVPVAFLTAYIALVDL
ncbi:polyketide synthase dehydratase domain-containing protein, partial [Mycobacterium simiae]|uniref:polyketide synthase dehydratase domain-containing protein n=1 Tax=Mycobacterium simiae TaxID=1784 RepID=UPI00165F8E15